MARQGIRRLSPRRPARGGRAPAGMPEVRPVSSSPCARGPRKRPSNAARTAPLVALRAGAAHDALFDVTDADGAAATVRLLAPPDPDDRWFAEQVARELGRYVGVTSPHLAPLLAVGAHDGRAYLVGSLLRGESLRARLGTPLPLAEVVALSTRSRRRSMRCMRAGCRTAGCAWRRSSSPRAGHSSATPGWCPRWRRPRAAPGGASAAPRPDPYRAPENTASTLRDPRADISRPRRARVGGADRAAARSGQHGRRHRQPCRATARARCGAAARPRALRLRAPRAGIGLHRHPPRRRAG